MIPRYSRPEMAHIWSEENRLRIMLEIEVLACEAMGQRGEIPADDVTTIRASADFDLQQVHEYERTLKHDVIAFLTSVKDHVGPAGRHVHKGLTSSDVLDTATGVQMKQAGELILTGLDRALEAVRGRALEHRHTLAIGRTHGIYAEPMTIGLKFAGWYAELKRARVRVEAAWQGVSVGKLSGAVGTYASIHPDVEAYVCDALGLEAETVATQVVPRDRHAAWFSALALLATSVERFATEIRHLQHSDLGEAREAFGKGQKGSSAMPHKRNPILSENLCGLARVVRSHALVAMENVPLWHERDISHSSAERVIAPDAAVTADFLLHRFASLVENLVVDEARVAGNLDRARGLFCSGKLMLALVETGMQRETAYRLVQRAAMRAWDEGLPLRQTVAEDADLSTALQGVDLQSLFDPAAFVQHLDEVYRRVFEE